MKMLNFLQGQARLTTLENQDPSRLATVVVSVVTTLQGIVQIQMAFMVNLVGEGVEVVAEDSSAVEVAATEVGVAAKGGRGNKGGSGCSRSRGAPSLVDHFN